MLPAYTFPEQIASSHLAKDRLKAFVLNKFEVEIIAPSPCRGLTQKEIKKYKKIPFEILYRDCRKMLTSF